MFYSQFILAKKGPLGTIWIAAHLERKLRKNQVTETNISVSVDSILFPEVPIALRLSGHLLLGVVRIYSRKVNYLFHDCSEALVKIKQAFHAGAVDLPPEAATAPFHSITLPETFDLDEFEPLLDRELNLLHSNGGNDHHVSSREQITLQDPLEDNSYLGSQFELDERFPEADAPRLGLDFDEDLLDKPLRETSPALATLEEVEEEERALEEDVIPPTTMDTTLDYDQMDRMDALDMDDDHQEPGSPGVNIDHMDLDYQHEVEGQELDQSHRSPGEMEQLEPDYRLDNDDELEGEKFEQVEGERPEQLEGDQFEQLEGDKFEQMEEERFEQTEGENLEHLEEEKFEQLDGDKLEQLEGRDEEGNRDLEFVADKPVEEEAAERGPEELTLKRDIEREFFGEDVEEEVLNREVEEEFFGKDVEGEIYREAEQVTFEKQADQQGGVSEQHEGGEEQEQAVREGFEGETEWGEKEEFEKEVPDYETVMSAPEPNDQEPDVFDMDNDMRSEQVPPMDYQDTDVVMEDREEGDLVLEEEAVPSLREEGPQVTMAEPESPGYPPLPAIGSDDLPGDDDVLASLLGRGTPALKVVQTPAETPAAKPRKRQNLKKRKLLVDMNTILGADVMKQQLMNTDDIRRVRRKAPCTRQELWSVHKENLSNQIFNENSVPGLCGELRELFARVYVVGEAKLPLAESPAPEVVASEEVPVPQRSPLVEDLSTTDLNVMAEQPAEGAVAEEEIQLPTDIHQQADQQEYQQADQQEYQHADPQEYQQEYRPVDGEELVALNVHPEGSPKYNEATHADDPGVASPAHAVEERAPASPQREAEADVVEGEAKPLDLNDEGFEYRPDMEYQAPLVAAEEEPIVEKEGDKVEEEFNAPELVEPVADTEVVHISETEIEGAIAPVTETEVEDAIPPRTETEVEGSIAPVVDVFGEPAPEPLREDEAVANVEVEFEAGTGTEIVPEDEALIYDQGAVEPQDEVMQEVGFEEIKTQEEEPIAFIPEEHIEERVAEPSALEEVVITEEQPEEEELGFLADTRDTEFLGADDDDLVDEAEDFQDGKDYGRRDQVQDNSGWSARTRAVGHYLRTTLEDKAAYMKKRQEEGAAKLGLERMLVGKTRKESARMFFETLVLKTKDYIHVEQDVPYGDIQISARPKLLKAKF